MDSSESVSNWSINDQQSDVTSHSKFLQTILQKQENSLKTPENFTFKKLVIPSLNSIENECQISNQILYYS